MRRVTVRIDRLVLNGYRPEDRHAIAAAVETELVRLLSTEAGLSRLTTLAQAPPQRITVAAERETKPAAIGRAIANGIAGENKR
jgi:hypothetical protein